MSDSTHTNTYKHDVHTVGTHVQKKTCGGPDVCMHAYIQCMHTDGWQSIFFLTPATSCNTSLSGSLSPPIRICALVIRRGLLQKVEQSWHQLPSGSSKGEVVRGGVVVAVAGVITGSAHLQVRRKMNVLTYKYYATANSATDKSKKILTDKKQTSWFVAALFNRLNQILRCVYYAVPMKWRDWHLKKVFKNHVMVYFKGLLSWKYALLWFDSEFGC